MVPGCGNIQESHAAARDTACRKHGKEHVRRMVIGRVRSLSRDLQDAVTAGEWLADTRTMPEVRRGLGQADVRRHATLRISVENGDAGKAEMRSGVPAAA